MRRVEMIMGTAITIEVLAPEPPGPAAGAVSAAFVWFESVDRQFSTYRDDSEVSRLRRGEVAEVSEVMRTVLNRCEDLRARTNGYFDAYATGSLDPSGFVKGWSVQVASDRLAEAGLPNHFINAGGDVRVRGHGPDGSPWRIGIAHPWQQRKVAWVVAGTDLAIATSGTYERGQHVLDPFSGRPAATLRSVTVTGPDLGAADAYATAAVAMGRPGLDWLASLSGYEAAVVTEDAQAFRSDGFPTVPAIEVPDGQMPAY